MSDRFLRLALVVAAAAWIGAAVAASGNDAADLTAPPAAQPGGKVDPQRFGDKKQADRKQLVPPAEAGVTTPPPAADTPNGTVDPHRFGEKQLDPAYGAFQR